MEGLTTPTEWRLRLQDGTILKIWADGFQERDEELVFGILVRAGEAEQNALDVTNRTPSDSERVVVTVARVHRSAVKEVLSG
jgi:hypothetical protein